MRMNFELPPVWQTGRSTTSANSNGIASPTRSRAFWVSTGEFLLCRLLRDVIRQGTLHVQMPSGRNHAFGAGDPVVDVRLTTSITVWRLLRNPELAAGEAYMDGTLQFERGAIYDLLELVNANLKWSSGPGVMRLNFKVRRVLRRMAQHNPVRRAQANVAHHYDLSDTLYALFLDGGLHKYIFPGGYAPALSEVVPAIERAGLYITDVEVLRLHYAHTLQAWRDRFMAERARIAELYDERFCRMWEFYLAYCEAGFRHSGLVVFQIQISKRIDTVPITRDYIAANEQGLAI